MTEPRATRRWFFFLAAASLGYAAVLVWAVVLREWWVVVIGVAAGLPSIIKMPVDTFNQLWPGSRFGRWYSRLPRLRLPKAQDIVAGFALFALLFVPLIVLRWGLNAVLLALVASFCAVSLFRLIRTIRKEGWSGEKRSGK
jgi:hypothetical protein